MLSNLDFVLIYGLLLSAIIGGGVVYWSIVNLRNIRSQQFALAADLAAALRELELMATITAKAALQAQRIERDGASLAERVGILELRGESRPYGQAIDSARDGADTAKLARQFGLSSNEAKLLKLVHGARSAE